MKSTMDRQLCDRGFTLVEMLLVLLLLSVILLVTPLLNRQQGILLRMDAQQIRELCIQAQAEAMKLHKNVTIQLRGSNVYKDAKQYPLQKTTSCDTLRFHYTPHGTISQAFTLHCRNASSSIQLVAQLGSGRLDVR
ncbi:prepilin-type N-terminal cleavage/methylation domain-containing protein [[Clostridium] innocuum]|nr:prepilin-type N-terminal cleavage/methylation domain-containing protein [[Clostridium] innocuum]